MALSYKCTSVGCYSYQSADTNILLQRLQTLINQFANALVFTPIKVDGIIGKGTTEKALIVLGYLSELDKGVVGASAKALEAQIGTPEQLTVGAQAVVDTLNLATRQPPSALVGQISPAAPLPSPTPAPSTTQLVTTTANMPTSSSSAATQNILNTARLKNSALSTSLIDRVPPWAAYASGAALAVGVLVAVVVGSKRKKAAPAPVAGW